MLEGGAPCLHRPEEPGDDAARLRPSRQRWRQRGRGSQHREPLRGQRHHRGLEQGEAEACQPRLRDDGRTIRLGDAHRRAGERRIGQRQRDNERCPSGPRPSSNIRYAHVREGTGTAADGPAAQRTDEAHHRQILHPQRTLHTGHQLQTRRRRIYGAYTRLADTGVPHTRRTHRSRRRRHHARRGGEARLAAEHRLLPECLWTRLYGGDVRL